MRIKARVENGNLVADAPLGYAEGEEIEFYIVEDLEELLSPEEIAALNKALARSRQQIEAGVYVSGDELIARLGERLR